MRDDAEPVVYRSLRPLLFRLDAERAHGLSLALLRWLGAIPPLRWALGRALAREGSEATVAFGLSFPNAVGLAAGYDKDGLAWRGLARLGFGHLELGTVTPRPQHGNPRPRLFRLVRERSLINRLGFPSRGAEQLAERLARRPAGGPLIGVNLGKQRETPVERADEEYDALVERFAPLADYLALNVSSPNTPELRRLEQAELLAPLLARLVRRRAALADRLGRRVPLLVKLSPDLDEGALDATLDAVVSAGVDGLIATNTTIMRDGLGLGGPAREEAGGLSGAALTARSTRVLRTIVERTGGGLPIVASGGVMSPADARARLDAGASLVQLYTGLVFDGPALVPRVLRAISATPR